MIVRLVVHVEWHRGYWPRLSVRRAPKHGDRGREGRLMRCPLCSGDGFLVRPHTHPTPDRAS